MIMRGRAISSGRAEGPAITYGEAFSFLGGVDAKTGNLNVRSGSVKDKVFLFPNGKGSTVGSYVIYDLMVHKNAPLALVNQSAETIVTTGAVISSVPMVDGVDVSLVKDGDIVVVDGGKGYVEIRGVSLKETVSSVIVSDGKILELHRPEKCHSFPGKWSLVSGSVESGESPEETARREVCEETGLKVVYPDAVGDVIYIREGNIVWKVHPFMYRCDGAKPKLNEENTEFRWVSVSDVSGNDLVDGVTSIVAGFSKII